MVSPFLEPPGAGEKTYSKNRISQILFGPGLIWCIFGSGAGGRGVK